MPDNYAVAELVADEFIRRKFRRFAFCSFATRASRSRDDWMDERMAAFCAAVRAAGAEPIVYETPTSTWGQCANEWSGALADWLRSLPKPIGIMAVNDMRARHLLLAAESIGLRVPEEVAVIGVDNDFWAKISDRGISSVDFDGYRAGYAAMEMLHQRLEGISVPRQVLRIPPRRLITRQSSDVTAVEDADVALALRFIAEHATAGISVEDVVRTVALSRRALELRFQAAVGRSMMQEIRAAQIERAMLLLADHTIPLRRVAKTAGFTSAKAQSKIFRRIVGITPSAYRAAAVDSVSPPRSPLPSSLRARKKP